MEHSDSTLFRNIDAFPEMERSVDAQILRRRDGRARESRMQSKLDRNFYSSLAIEGYELHERLGSGGTSVVYRATRRGESKNSYAIKVLTLAALDRGAQIRFDREVKVLQRLRHRSIARLYESGVARNGQPYLVLDYVDGCTIAQFCRDQQLTVNDRVRIFIEVCEALEYAHSKGILHRDIKPGNVLIDRNGHPTLTDFGLAKFLQSADIPSEETRTGVVLGTLNYLAPEQIFATRHEIGETTDVFGMGALLYKLLTGKAPFQFDNLVEAARDYFRRSPVGVDADVEVPARLEAICIKCLSPKPSDRYSSVAELRRDLRRYLDGQSVSVRHSRLLRRASLLHRHNPTLSMALLAMLIVAVFCGGTFFSLWRSAQLGLQESERKTELLKQGILGYADQVRAQENDPATLVHRWEQLRYIRTQLLKLQDEFDEDPELLFAHAVNDFKLGEIEQLLGKDEARLTHFKEAERNFQRLIPVEKFREEALFGYFHSLIRREDYQGALPIIDVLCDEFPGKVYYTEARCTVLLRLASRIDLMKDFDQAANLLAMAEPVIDQLLEVAEEHPAFYRKVIQANEERCRLLVHQGELDEAQELMWETLMLYENFDMFGSPVVSESVECLDSHQFAIAIAAMRRDSDATEELFRSAREIYDRAVQRYSSFPHLYKHWTLLLSDCLAARRRMHFAVDMSELSHLMLDALNKWQGLLPDEDIWRQEAIRFHASAKIPHAELSIAQAHIKHLLAEDQPNLLSTRFLQTQLLRLGRFEEACNLPRSAPGGYGAKSYARYLDPLLSQIEEGTPIDRLQYEEVPDSLQWQILAESRRFDLADLNQTLREIVRDGQAAIASREAF